jgi:hypothetical protein
MNTTKLATSIVRAKLTNKHNRSKLTSFDGVLVLALNKASDNPMCAVWPQGANLNDEYFTPHVWPNWSSTFDTQEGKVLLWDESKQKNRQVIRHYAKVPGECVLMNKSELKTLMGITHLRSTNCGHRIFRDTPIGDVLYITYDTNADCFLEAISKGFIDKKCRINVDEEHPTIDIIDKDTDQGEIKKGLEDLLKKLQ